MGDVGISWDVDYDGKQQSQFGTMENCVKNRLWSGGVVFVKKYIYIYNEMQNK